MNHPASWSRFHVLRKNAVVPDNRYLNVFGTRFLLAKNLQVVEVDGMSARTADAYTACLKVGLAYAAVEAFENSKVIPGKIHFSNASLAKQLRDSKNKFMIENIIKHEVVRNGNKKRLQEFMESTTEDLREPIYSIRNLMFHGSLTANFLKLDTSKARRKLIYDLADTTLETVDTKFTEYVNSFE